MQKALSLMWLGLAGMVLFLSVWRQVEHQVQAGLVPPNLPPEMNMPMPTEAIMNLPNTIHKLPALPGEPVYVMYMMRDRIKLWTAPFERKAEIMMDYAESRMWAAEELQHRQETDLALTTASKAAHYLTNASGSLLKSDVPLTEAVRLWDKLSGVATDHQKRLKTLKEYVPDPVKPSVEKIMEEVAMVEERARAMSVSVGAQQ